MDDTQNKSQNAQLPQQVSSDVPASTQPASSVAQPTEGQGTSSQQVGATISQQPTPSFQQVAGETSGSIISPIATPQASSPDKPMQELVDQIERDLLAHIYTNLKENKLTGVAAQQLAQEFLALLPFKDKKDLVDKLSSLGQKYPEARQTYVNLGIPLEEQQREERLEQMRAHIKSGDLDKALEVAKGGASNGTS